MDSTLIELNIKVNWISDSWHNVLYQVFLLLSSENTSEKERGGENERMNKSEQNGLTNSPTDEI